MWIPGQAGDDEGWRSWEVITYFPTANKPFEVGKVSRPYRAPFILWGRNPGLRLGGLAFDLG